jgi:hypothetical protein
MTGDLIGTLRYMRPEQALAKRVVVDHRTDIYSLGATRYELMTLQPAFTGEDRQELLRQIAFEDPRPPRRLAKTIPAELETIVLKAMEKNPAERYATGKELADDLRHFLEDKPIRARRLSLLVRWRKWARRRKPTVAAAALGMLAVILVLAGACGWVMRDREARRQAAERAISATLQEAMQLAKKENWAEAQAAARRAEALAGGIEELAELCQHVQELLSDLKMVKTLEEIRLEQTTVKDDHFDLAGADAANDRAFRAYGIDLGAVGADEAGEWLGGRTICVQLAAALDNWAMLRKARKKPSWKLLLTVARAIDPDKWRNRIREALERGDNKELRDLAAALPFDELPASTLVLVGLSLESGDSPEDAARLLRKAQRLHRDDFWVNNSLAQVSSVSSLSGRMSPCASTWRRWPFDRTVLAPM